MPSEPRRLHLLSWMFIAGANVKSLIFPAIVVLLFSRGAVTSSYEIWGLIFIVPTLALALIQQGVYNYRFGAEEMVVRDGVITKKERHIPYERVHNVALVRNPLHRMLGVASVRIETASGGEPEAVMRVLSLGAVDELRDHTLGRERVAAAAAAGDTAALAHEAVPDGAAAERAATAPTVLLELSPGELVRLGLISNRGFIIVAAAMGLLSQMTWWDVDWEEWAPYYNRVREEGTGWLMWLDLGSITARVLAGVALVVVFLVLLRLFSVAWHLVKYYGFTLHQDDKDLRSEYGLFTQVSTTVPAYRIQLLTARATLLHRWFDRSTVELETAGASQEGSDLQSGLAAGGVKMEKQWLAPLVETSRANALLRKVLPEIDLDAVAWQPLAPRARWRIIKRFSLVTALVTVLPFPLIGFHVLWIPAVILPLGIAYATGFVRYAGYALTDQAVVFRSGWLSRKVSVVRFDKMQTVSLNESPFDRRHRMASVAVDTAGAAQVGHRIDIPLLDKDVAEAIARRLYAEASQTEYSW